MAKKSKQKLLFIMVILSMLFISSIYAALIPNVHAAEPTTQEKAIEVLNDVVGLDMTAYRISLSNYFNGSYLYTGLPEETLDYTLDSQGSKLKIGCAFVNGTLRLMRINERNGAPRMTQPATNVLDEAKGFLSRYKDYSGDSRYQALRSMLDTVNANENTTKTSGNAKLEVNVNEKYTTFRWKYAVNEVEAEFKWTTIGFENGFLKYYIDTWNLYRIGSEDINLSKEEAINIALNAAKDFSWKVNRGNSTIEVTEFNITGISEPYLFFGNEPESKDARDGDPLTLYPAWVIRLYFDQVYPGYATGLIVKIWADTKEVSYIIPAAVMGRPSNAESPSDNKGAIGAQSDETPASLENANQNSTWWLAIPTSITIAFGMIVVYFRRKKFAPFRKLMKTVTPNASTLGGALLCLLISFMIVSMPTSPAYSAEAIPNPGGSAITYGSTWELYFNATYSELSAAQWVNSQIKSYFIQAGYDVTDAWGSPTQKENVLAWASNREQNYHRVAIFHHGHGYGDYDAGQFQYTYFDNDGNGTQDRVHDYSVYPQTGLGKHFFVFLWVCEQASEIGFFNTTSNKALGMPFAWTHRNASQMSSDGYGSPDNGLSAFIGFDGFSIPLANPSPNNSSVMMKYFVDRFYYHALIQGDSVNEALDSASSDWYGTSFGATDLYSEYSTWWPGLKNDNSTAGMWNGTMVVFGNGNIHLNQLDFTVLAKDQYSNEFANKDVYIDLMHNVANTGATIKVTEGSHTFYVNDFWETVNGQPTGYRYYFDYYEFGPSWYYYPQTVEDWDFDEDWNITAHFDKQYHPGDVDGDEDRDPDDLDAFSDHLGTVRGDYTQNYDSTCDFDSDGDVDGGDRAYLYSLFNTAVYHLDEGENSTVYDSSLYGNNGTVYGADWTTGISDSALSFNGVNDYVEAYPFDYDFTEITAEFWMKTSDTTKTGTPISCSSGTQHNEFLLYNYKSFDIYVKGSSVSTGVSANDGFWHHIAVTWRNSDGLVKLYKDGNPVYTGTLQSGATINLANLIIGQEQDTFRGGFDSNQAFKGIIDEVRIYDRMLSQAEIEDNYEALLPHHQLTVYCWDLIYEEQIDYEEISIDDGEYWDYGYLSVSVSEGLHTIEVSQNYAYFMYFYDGIDYYYENPLTTYFTSDTTIAAVYYTY